MKMPDLQKQYDRNKDLWEQAEDLLAALALSVDVWIDCCEVPDVIQFGFARYNGGIKKIVVKIEREDPSKPEIKRILESSIAIRRGMIRCVSDLYNKAVSLATKHDEEISADNDEFEGIIANLKGQ